MNSASSAAIIGASGFIGTRLAEILTLRERVPTRAFVRSFGRAARLSRLPLEILGLSLDDPNAVAKSLSGCSVVYYTVFDHTSVEANLQALRNVARTCKANGARLIYLSSLAVYGVMRDGDLTESAISQPCGFPYADQKLAVETEAFRLASEEGVDVVILQPSIVYGPYGDAWTLGPARQLCTGTVVLPRFGEGYCNAVYVDDVCDAMIAAARAPAEASGQRFLISAAQPVTWKAFWEALQMPFGRDALKLVPAETEGRPVRSNPLAMLKQIVGNPKALLEAAPIRPLAMRLKGRLSANAKSRIKTMLSAYQRIAPTPVFAPTSPYRRALLTARCHVRIDKARAILGYDPKYDLEAGMRLTQDYLRWAFADIKPD